MGQFTIKNVPFIHAIYGREITCTFGGTERPEMTPPPHTNQRCTMTPMENKMSEIKTGSVFTQEMVDNGCQVEHGMRFMTEVGEYVALFTNIKSVCFADEDGFLIAINRGYAKPIPAPIELVDGAAYMFNSHEDNLLDAIGVYSKVHNTLTTFKNLCAAFDCTNIRLMTVESK
mgnify:CR=1 FL=1